MTPYTVNDLIASEVEYDHRDWIISSLVGPSAWKYSKVKAVCFTTKDGKYTTGTPDSDDFSYWRDANGIRLGKTSVDFVFGTFGNEQRVVDNLNKLLQQGH
jgi:hypothetical protein